MRERTPERATLLVGALVLAASFGAGGYTYATFVDIETTSASIGAANDFTTAVDVARIKPTRIEANSGGGLASSNNDGNGDDAGDGSGGSDGGTDAGNGVFTVYADVPDPERVDSDRFTLRVAGSGGSIRALRAKCKPRASGDWTCEATFSRRALLALGVERGSVKVVLQGWWEYDRDFEGTTTVAIVDAGSTSTAADGAESGTETEPAVAAEETDGPPATEPATTETTGTTTATESDEPGPPAETAETTESATANVTKTTNATNATTAQE